MIKIILSSLCFCLLSTGIYASSVREITGSAKPIDGKTLIINEQKIQLSGIDTPDFEQMCQHEKKRKPFQCGLVSTLRLIKLVRHQQVTCRGNEYNSDGLLLAVCYVGRININEQMVLQGWAVADDNVTNKKYKQLEQGANNLKYGLWDGHFIRPSEWRKGKRLPPSPYKVEKVIRVGAE